MTKDDTAGDVKAETIKDSAAEDCISGICWLRAIIGVTTIITSANHVFAAAVVVADILLAVERRDSGRRTMSVEDFIVSWAGRELFLFIHAWIWMWMDCVGCGQLSLMLERE